jgi:hypothetical protein
MPEKMSVLVVVLSAAPNFGGRRSCGNVGMYVTPSGARPGRWPSRVRNVIRRN